VRQIARTSRTETPVPLIRCAATRGPMPASISITPVGARTTEQFPDDPLARMQSSRDIRVSTCYSEARVRARRVRINVRRNPS
jgi:hypothetical protein